MFVDYKILLETERGKMLCVRAADGKMLKSRQALATDRNAAGAGTAFNCANIVRGGKQNCSEKISLKEAFVYPHMFVFFRLGLQS